MTAPIADHLSRAKLLDRITEAMRDEQARKDKGTDWYTSGLIQGLAKALDLIGSTVAEPGCIHQDKAAAEPAGDYWDGYTAGFLDGKLTALDVIEQTMPDEYRMKSERDALKETD